MATILNVSVIFAFLITFFATPFFIRYFRFVNLTSTDVHKKNQPMIPHSAGIPVAIGIVFAMLLYIFLNVFIYGDSAPLLKIFAAITTILIITGTGFIDDLNSVQVRFRGHIEGKLGLRRWQKPLLTLPAALPLMAIMAGATEMTFPIIGTINFGILYPLLIIPIGVVGTSNMINMLGGFNGLEAGMGAVYTFSLGIFALMNARIEAALIFLSASAAMLALLRYNFSPAKILPGDTLPYVLGAVVAAGAIIGNIERAAIIVMTPFLIQGALKFYSLYKLGRFASDLGVLQSDGTLKSKYGNEIYSWTHILMRYKLTERQIVAGMILIQIIFSLIPFLGVF